MKATILALLKTKFVGLADNVLEGIADKAGKTCTTEDAAKTYVDELTFQNILESYADRRVGEATKTAVSNYEKKYGLKDGKAIDNGDPKPQPTPTPTPQPTPNPEMAALLDSIKSLQGEIAAMKKGKMTETRSATLGNLTKGLTAAQQKAYSRINLTDMSDEDFDTFVQEVTEEVKQIETDNRASATLGNKPLFGGSQGKPGEASDDEVAKLMGITK